MVFACYCIWDMIIRVPIRRAITLLTKYFGTEMTSVKNIFVIVVILTWLTDQVEGMILVVFHATT